MSETLLPPVAPGVTAEIVDALPSRLRKRLDGAVKRIATRPVERDGETVTVAVDEDTRLVLHAPSGAVTRADAVRCGCLLAPTCLHRAAVASAAPAADPDSDTDEVPEGGARSDAAPAAQAAPEAAGEAVGAPQEESATAAQRQACEALRTAGAAVLEVGLDGAGAVVQAGLLRAAHSAKLCGLHRPAAAAVSVVTLLRAARGADPAYRTADLVAALTELLDTAHRVPTAPAADLASLRGSARQPYRPDGSLRLYGLFTEPVVTESGHGGARCWVLDSGGRLYTVSDVAPGGAARATAVADRTVRLGDTALTHRELSRAGLAVSGATVSPDGRLGAGAGVRAVAAPGAGWTREPHAALWDVPPAEQAARALRFLSGRADGDSAAGDLLFLDVTLTGTAREAGGACLLAECGEVTVRLTAAHEDRALAYRDNLRLLSCATGTRMRIVGRLVPASHARLRLLACTHPGDPDRSVDLGFDRLQRADLPTASQAAPGPRPVPVAESAPLHLIGRRIEQTVTAGRGAVGLLDGTAEEARRLRRAGLPTAGLLLTELCSAAAVRERDAFGRLLPSDTVRFARRWLGAAHYATAVNEALCAAAWR